MHDLKALAPFANELRQQLRRMLEIGVHHDDGAAARGGEPGHQGALVTEVARQPDAAHPHIGGAERVQAIPSAVAAAVVDDDELPIAIAERGIQHLAHVRVQHVEIAFLVVRWYHDGNHSVTLEQSRLLKLAMFVPLGAPW